MKLSKRTVETVPAKQTPLTCQKCGLEHWPNLPCSNRQQVQTNETNSRPVLEVVPNTALPAERFKPTCKFCGKQHWPLDPSCIGKKGAKAEAKAKARAQKRAQAEAKAKAKADAKATARAEKEAGAKARVQAKAHRKAAPEDIETIKAETEWAKAEITKARAQAETAIAEAQKARAEAQKVRTDYAQIATPQQQAAPVSEITAHAANAGTFSSLCAKDIMQKDVLWATTEHTVQQALTRMHRYSAAYMMIGRDKVPAGIVSKSDLTGAISPYLRPEFAKWRRPLDDATLNIKLKWAMSSPIHAIDPNTPLLAVIQNMRRRSTRCMPVVDTNGSVQGLVTVFDVFKALLACG
ncbi:MAG: CBS domain-containing protein [Planctomycetota bacterium]